MEEEKEGNQETLRDLLNKINHPLFEVRCRAVKSIKFKLTNEIIALSDLCYDRTFLVNLLEWFNFDEWAYEQVVLELLKELTEFEMVSQIIQEVGGVQFLSQLRSHLDLTCQQTIDLILENLLKLPPSISDSKAVSSPRSAEHSTHNHTQIEEPFHFSASHLLSPLVTPTDYAQCTTSDHTHIDVFPWLQLSQVDCQVLATTLSRLQSPDIECINMTCTFVNEVLLKDFPPEIFLQRPAIVECLLSKLSPGEGYSLTDKLVFIHSLLYITDQLHEKLFKQTDTRTTDCKDKLIISTASGSEVQFAVPSTGLERHSTDVLAHLQSRQISLMSFCNNFISSALHLLFTTLDSHLPWLDDKRDSGNHGDKARHVELADLAGKVMRCIKSVSKLVLSYFCISSNKNEIISVLDILSICLNQLIHKLKRAQESGLTPYPLLQLICPFISLLTIEFTNIFSSVINKLPSHQLSTNIHTAIVNILTHTFLTITCNTLEFVSYLATIDPGMYQVLSKEKQLYDSFQNLYDFLKLSTADTVNDKQLLKMAERCLLALQFNYGELEHQYIQQVITLCIRSLLSSNEQSAVTTCQSLILQLSAHNIEGVRILTYILLEQQSDSYALSMLFTASFIEKLTNNLLSTNVGLSSAAQSLLSDFVSSFQQDKNQLMKLINYLPFIECSVCCNSQMMGVVNVLLDHTPKDVKTCSLLRAMYLSKKEENSSTQISKLISLDNLDPSISIYDCTTKELYVPIISKSTNFKCEDVTKLMSILNSKSVERSLKISAMEQLTVILQDSTLQETAAKEGLVNLIWKLLDSKINGKEAKQEKEEGHSLLLLSLLCLQLLTFGSKTIRDTLSNDSTLLLTIYKGCLIFHGKDDNIFSRLSQLLALLVFSPVLEFLHPHSEIKINEGLLQHLKLPFAVKSISNSTESSFLFSSLLHSLPTCHRLWVYYIVSSFGGIDRVPYQIHQSSGPMLTKEYIKFDGEITEDEMKAVLFELQCIIYSISSLTTWSTLQLFKDRSLSIVDINHILKYFNISILNYNTSDQDNFGDKALTNLKTLFDKSLSIQDHTVLIGTLNSLSLLLETCNSCNLIGQQQWLIDAVFKKSKLHSILSAAVTKLNKELCTSILNFFASLLSVANGNHPLPLDLMKALYKILSTCNEQNSITQLTLKCLMLLVKGTRSINVPSSSKIEWTDLNTNLLTSLKQIIVYILKERGTIYTSFMNKGILYNAVISLTHVLVNVQQLNKELLSSWLLSDTSLVWIHSLLYDRNPQISCATYSILSTLASQTDCTKCIISSWKDLHTHGLLGACIDTGLDNKEYSWTRHQSLTAAVNIMLTCHEQWETLWPEYEQTLFVSFLNDNCLVQIFQELLDCLLHQCDVILDIKPVKQVLESSLTTETLHTVDIPSDEDKQVSETGFDSEELFCSLYTKCQPLVISGLCQFVSCYIYLSSSVDILGTRLDQLISTINKLLNSQLLKCLFQFSKSKKCLNDTTIISIWIELYTRIISLLHIISINTVNIYQSTSTVIFSSLLKLIGNLKQSPSSVNSYINNMYIEIISFLRRLCCHGNAIDTLISNIVQYWTIFYDLLYYSIEVCESTDKLFVNCWSFICTLIMITQSTDSQSTTAIQQSFISLLDSKHITATETSSICTKLVGVYESSIDNKVVKDVSLASITLLVAISDTAKDGVVKAGFLESTINKLMSLHEKISVHNVRKLKSKNKVSNDIDKLVKCFKFLQNLCYKSHSIKSIAVKYGLVTALQVLWPLCVTSDEFLLHSYLNLLIVLTARCPDVHVSLVCHTRQGNGLFHELVKFLSMSLMSSSVYTATATANKTLLSSNAAVDKLFNILTNCTMTQECRTIFKKTNFLSCFHLLVAKSKPNKLSTTNNSLIRQWLRFIINLTFTTDGQSLFIKLSGSIDILCTIWCHSSTNIKHQLYIITALRNLCFHGPAKLVLANNVSVIDIFIDALRSSNPDLTTNVSMGISALLYNNSKLKTQLRNSDLHKALTEVADTYKSVDQRCHDSVTNTLSLFSNC